MNPVTDAQAVEAVNALFRVSPKSQHAKRLKQWVAAHCGLNPNAGDKPLIVEANAAIVTECATLRRDLAASLERLRHALERVTVAERATQEARTQLARVLLSRAGPSAPSATARRKPKRKGKPRKRKPLTPQQKAAVSRRMARYMRERRAAMRAIVRHGIDGPMLESAFAALHRDRSP